METLNGKTAFITGAGKGLGKAIALELAKNNVNLGLVARTEADLKAVAEEAKKVNPEIKVAYAVADITSNEQVVSAFDNLKAELGQVDILVNNAGIGQFGKFLDLSVEDWENVVKTNVFGAYYATRAVLAEMKDRKSGDIVNISSSAGLKGAAVTSAYSASKFGMIGMSESLMQEVRKDNIRVFTMTPSRALKAAKESFGKRCKPLVNKSVTTRKSRHVAGLFLRQPTLHTFVPPDIFCPA